MSGQNLLLLGAVQQAVPDPNFEYTTLLLPGNGTNGAQNNTFLDSSTNAFSITRNGNTTQGTFSPFSQTGWGNYFDGSGDYLSLADNAALNLGTGDFTLEGWVYITGFPGSNAVAMIAKWASGNYAYIVQILSPSTLRLYTGNNGSLSSFYDQTYTWQRNSWTHIAITRESSTLRFFVNGLLIGSNSSITQSLSNSSSFVLGQNLDGGGQDFTGYMSNVRVVKGTAVYTANFTPPTTPLTAITNTSLLTCQSNRFIDNSSNNFAITRNGDVSVQAFSPFNPTAAWSAATYGGSGYFDGSGDYLTIGGNSNLAFGTGDFTIEFWAYINSFASAFQHLYDGRPATTDGSYPTIRLNSATLEYVVGGAVQITGSAVTGSTWNHFAVCRSGASTKMFLNGIQTGSTYADSNNYLNPASRPAIGGWGYNLSGGYSVSGYMGDVRSIKGTALYTANFTPPTAPLTAITNTQLLCNFTNAGIYDATSKNDLETVGNAQISTTQSKFGGSSMYFDGTGDYCLFPVSQNFAFGTGDFTLECWIRTNRVTQSLFGLESGTGSYGLVFAAGDLYWQSSTMVTNLMSASAASILDNNWHHVALTRYNGTSRMFFDGVQVTSAADSTNYTATTKMNVGYQHTSTNYYLGYIQDIRITKGIARYTSNFTPPSTAFLTL